MGLFHKTLKNAENKFSKGNYKAALKIIEKHINEEHSLRGTFANLNEYYSKFSGRLEQVEAALIAIIQDGYSKVYQQDFKSALDAAEKLISEMELHAQLFLKLCREEE